MKNKSIISVFSLAIILLISGCAHDHSSHEGHDHGEEAHADHSGHGHEEHEEHPEGEIHLTKDQIKAMDIGFGDFSQIKINDFISATGTLGLPPNAYSSVNARANGFIKNTKKQVEGSYIKKGAILAYLENPEFIKHQQKYLEISAELDYLKQELARHQSLVDANAGALKNVQQTQSEINIKTATQKGLAKQMAYLGIDVSALSVNNIVERIAIFSPMSGYITSIKMHNGLYVTPELELMEVVSEQHLHLEMDIFEADIAGLKEGQEISYTVPALGNTVYKGEVHVIGKEFNTENKTVRIHGHLEKERPKFIKDLFIEAKIWLNDQTVQALPEKAIIKNGASSYIYITDEKSEGNEVIFKQIMVNPGLSEKGFTAVKLIDKLPSGVKIVTEGAYFVFAQSKVGELKHEH